MKQAIKITVLMAGQYEIPKGARIDFHLDKEKQIYVAACETNTFGIAKTMRGGRKEDLESLGIDFSGLVLAINLEKRLMKVKVITERSCG